MERVVRLLTVLGFAAATMVAVPAQAVEDPLPVLLWTSAGGTCTNEDHSDCGMIHISARADTAAIPAGSTALLQVRGCQGDTDVRDVTAGPDTPWLARVGTPYLIELSTVKDETYLFSYSFFTHYPGESFHLGPDWSATLTVTRPGMDPSVYEFDHGTVPPGVYHPFGLLTDDLVCPADDVDAAALVHSWSEVRGKPVVGRKVRVTPTRLDPVAAVVGGQVSYTWFAGSKVVGTTRVLKVRQSYVGRPIRVRYQVTAPGKKTAGATVKLGVVRAHR